MAAVWGCWRKTLRTKSMPDSPGMLTSHNTSAKEVSASRKRASLASEARTLS